MKKMKIVFQKQHDKRFNINNFRRSKLLRLFLFPGVQKKTKRKKTREVEQNKMNNERINELAKSIYKIVDKLEQRISKLEKVLASHAKCIGQLREDNNE